MRSESNCRGWGPHLLTWFVIWVDLLLARSTHSGCCREATEAHVSLPLLLFHVGTNDTARGELGSTKRDYRALGEAVKGMVAQGVLSSILLVRWTGLRRTWQILWVNYSLHCCCWQQGFSFYGHGTSLRVTSCLEEKGSTWLNREKYLCQQAYQPAKQSFKLEMDGGVSDSSTKKEVVNVVGTPRAWGDGNRRDIAINKTAKVDSLQA